MTRAGIFWRLLLLGLLIWLMFTQPGRQLRSGVKITPDDSTSVSTGVHREPLGLLQSDSAPGYAQARPGVQLSFPEDHGPHPDFRLEWWYLTANLRRENGESLGLQWTLFRSALAEADQSAIQSSGQVNYWHSRQLYMQHVALTDSQQHLAAQRFARGSESGAGELALAGVTNPPLHAWLEESSLRSAGSGADPGSANGLLPMTLNTRIGAYQLQLTISGQQQPVLQGDQGFSRKHPLNNTGSHYYSLPHLLLDGELRGPGGSERISGRGWLDREWSSAMLADDQLGWDWLSLHLDSGEAVMLYRLRHSDGDDYLSASWISADSQRTALQPEQFSWQPTAYHRVAGRRLPLGWQLVIPEYGVDLQLVPLNPDSWMDLAFAYWEGPLLGSGSHQAEGYLELTGYPLTD